MKKLLAILLVALMLISLSTPAFAATTQSYTDVPTSHWAFSHIESCRTKGLMQGTGNRLFDPEARLSRAQVAQICYNAYKTQLTNTNGEAFTDVSSSAWYYDAINWMNANGIVDSTTDSSGNLRYYPDVAADRGYVALALYRLADSLDVALPKKEAVVVFPDIAGLQPEYQNAISALQQAGVISGFPDGRYRPNEPLTRAQAAKLMDVYTDISGLKSFASPIVDPPVINPPPATDPDFLSKKTFDALYDYAVSLDYRPMIAMPENGSIQMTFWPNNKNGETWMVSIVLWEGADSWTGRARLGDGITPGETIPLNSIAEMKAFLTKYAN